MDTLTLERANAAALGITVKVGADDRPGPDAPDADHRRWTFGQPVRRNPCPLCEDGVLTIENSAICRACMRERLW